MWPHCIMAFKMSTTKQASALSSKKLTEQVKVKIWLCRSMWIKPKAIRILNKVFEFGGSNLNELWVITRTGSGWHAPTQIDAGNNNTQSPKLAFCKNLLAYPNDEQALSPLDARKIELAWKRCPLVSQGHPWNLKVTQDQKIADFDLDWILRDCNSLIITQIEHFPAVAPVWIYWWLPNNAQSLMSHRGGVILFLRSIFVHHFVFNCEFKLDLLFGNAQIGAKLLWTLWPWPLTSDLNRLQGHFFCHW